MWALSKCAWEGHKARQGLSNWCLLRSWAYKARRAPTSYSNHPPCCYPYIPLWHLETSSPEHARANPTKYTSDRTFSNFRELTQTVNVLDLNNVNNTQNSCNVSPQQNLPGTGQQSEVNDGESPERHRHFKCLLHWPLKCVLLLEIVSTIRLRIVVVISFTASIIFDGCHFLCSLYWLLELAYSFWTISILTSFF